MTNAPEGIWVRFFHEWYSGTHNGEVCVRRNIQGGINILKDVVEWFTVFHTTNEQVQSEAEQDSSSDDDEESDPESNGDDDRQAPSRVVDEREGNADFSDTILEAALEPASMQPGNFRLNQMLQEFVKNAQQANANFVGDGNKRLLVDFVKRVKTIQAQLLSPPTRSLAFFGDSGVGKTFVMDSMLRTSVISNVAYKTDTRSAWAAISDLQDVMSTATKGIALRDVGESKFAPIADDGKSLVKNEHREAETMQTESKGIPLRDAGESKLAYVLPPNADDGKFWFVNNEERELEAKSIKVWGKLEKSEKEKGDMMSFLLRTAEVGQGMATTQHNLKICHGAKYQLLVEYETRESICSKLSLFKFRTDEAKIIDETKEEDADTDVKKCEEAVMEDLLKAVAKSCEFIVSENATEANNVIVFKDDAENCFGKTLAFLSNGNDAMDDRIYIRRILNQLMFHGLNKHGVAFTDAMNANSGDASTKLIKNIRVYAPSALLLNNVEWIDCPGCNDVDPVREQLLQKTLNECDSLIFLASRLDSKAPLQMFKKYIVPRMDFANQRTGNVTKLNSFAFAFMNEKERLLSTEFNSEDEYNTKNKELNDRVWDYISTTGLSQKNKQETKVKAFFNDSTVHVFPGAYTALIQQGDAVKRRELLKFANGRWLIDFFCKVSCNATLPEDLKALAVEAREVAKKFESQSAVVGTDSIDFGRNKLNLNSATKRRVFLFARWSKDGNMARALDLLDPIASDGLKQLALPCEDYLMSLDGSCPKRISSKITEKYSIQLQTALKAFLKNGTAHAARVLEVKNLYFNRFAIHINKEIEVYLNSEDEFSKVVGDFVLKNLSAFTKSTVMAMYKNEINEENGTDEDVLKAQVAIDAYFNAESTRATAIQKVRAVTFKESMERRRKLCRDNIGIALKTLFYDTFTFSLDDQSSREKFATAYGQKHEVFVKKIRDEGYVREQLLKTFVETSWRLAKTAILGARSTTVCMDILDEALKVLDPPVNRTHTHKLARHGAKDLLRGFAVKLCEGASKLDKATTAANYEEVFLEWRNALPALLTLSVKNYRKRAATSSSTVLTDEENPRKKKAKSFGSA